MNILDRGIAVVLILGLVLAGTDASPRVFPRELPVFSSQAITPTVLSAWNGTWFSAKTAHMKYGMAMIRLSQWHPTKWQKVGLVVVVAGVLVERIYHHLWKSVQISGPGEISWNVRLLFALGKVARFIPERWLWSLYEREVREVRTGIRNDLENRKPVPNWEKEIWADALRNLWETLGDATVASGVSPLSAFDSIIMDIVPTDGENTYDTGRKLAQRFLEKLAKAPSLSPKSRYFNTLNYYMLALVIENVIQHSDGKPAKIAAFWGLNHLKPSPEIYVFDSGVGIGSVLDVLKGHERSEKGKYREAVKFMLANVMINFSKKRKTETVETAAKSFGRAGIKMLPQQWFIQSGLQRYDHYHQIISKVGAPIRGVLFGFHAVDTKAPVKLAGAKHTYYHSYYSSEYRMEESS